MPSKKNNSKSKSYKAMMAEILKPSKSSTPPQVKVIGSVAPQQVPKI